MSEAQKTTDSRLNTIEKDIALLKQALDNHEKTCIAREKTQHDEMQSIKDSVVSLNKSVGRNSKLLMVLIVVMAGLAEGASLLSGIL